MIRETIFLTSTINRGEKAVEGVSKVLIYPLAPQGGNYKYLYIKKSPLGDLGVNIKKRAFETPLFISILVL